MKKFITLLLAVGAFATSFAQYNHHQNNDGWNDRPGSKRDDQYANSSHGNRNYDGDDRGHYNRGNRYSQKEREFQIEKINRDFDFKVRAIKSDPYLRRREKRAAIRNAEIERSRQIQFVNERFISNNNRHY